MKGTLATSCVLLGLTSAVFSGEASMDREKLLPTVRDYLEEREREFSQLPEERKAQLRKLASFVETRMQAKQPARLTFICTHNSRRSHMSQIWAQAAAAYYGVPGVETFSGGTEATAFNPRAVTALGRAGFQISRTEDAKNPRYDLRYAEADKPLVCFSKVYNETPNPREEYCAVMTCSQADRDCPVVRGAAERIVIPYDDPKVADDTPEESAKYDERCRQVCREMLYVFSQVKH